VFWDSGKEQSDRSLHIVYSGKPLLPYSVYNVSVNVWDNYGETAASTAAFETAKLGESWAAQWITCGGYVTPEKGSPKPMLFKKAFTLSKEIKSARIYSTALGCYELELNGKKVGKDYFAPGYTSYHRHIQYQTYDITKMLTESNILFVTVAGVRLRSLDISALEIGPFDFIVPRINPVFIFFINWKLPGTMLFMVIPPSCNYNKLLEKFQSLLINLIYYYCMDTLEFKTKK
jgi:hypothetical protein